MICGGCRQAASALLLTQTKFRVQVLCVVLPGHSPAIAADGTQLDAGFGFTRTTMLREVKPQRHTYGDER